MGIFSRCASISHNVIILYNKKKFIDYNDMEERAGLKEPINHISKRILEEITGETQFKLFVRR